MCESVGGQNESNFYLSRQAPCLLGISCVGPEKIKTNLLWRHALEQDTMCFLFVFCIFIDLDFVSVRKDGPKKELNQYPVPSVGTVAQITYNIGNNLAKQ